MHGGEPKQDIPSDEIDDIESPSELPFKYERVFNDDEAQYKIWRTSPLLMGEGDVNSPKSDLEILDDVKKKNENKHWYTSEEWRGKGMPEEQIEFQINENPITVYNFNSEISFSDEHILRTERTLKELVSRFTEILEKVQWILVNDIQPPSLLGDDQHFPTNGRSIKDDKAIVIMPRGMEFFPHRISSTSNFEGTIVHEIGHLLFTKFANMWKEKFQWAFCGDNEEEWEVRKAPNGKDKWFHKLTGKMSPIGQYPLQPEQCVSEYAQIHMEEDICESLVAYIFDPEKLKEISPEKFAILKSYDTSETKGVNVNSRKVAKTDINLPIVNPETIKYYIEEPKDDKISNITFPTY